ncbi:MAG: hypothetical protein HXS54_18365 [Theionarchaea archaeon]|nr:hypothetical protein [Theionarchaea archaeon]
MKGKILASVFLTALLALSTITGLDSNITVNLTVPGEETLTLSLEKVSENGKFVTVKFTDTDMALFQYYFAIARVIEGTDFTVTDIKPGYYVVVLGKKSLKQNGSNYTLELPSSVLKKNIDTTVLTGYQGKEFMMAHVYAKDKYLRTFVSIMGTDIAGVNLEEGYMTAFVSYDELLALHLSGFAVEVVSSDVGILQLEPEYYTYPEVVTELSQIESDHSAIAKVISLGTSYEGRDIPGIKISDNVGTEESEPEIFICALHHAREAATVNVSMYIINYLTDNYTNPYVASLIDNREIYIFPVINPDGKVYDDSGGSYGSGLLWRKNRQPCTGGIGTDLNRNYSYMWGGAGSSGYCTSETFRGYEPFDAPETAAVRDFFTAHPDINVLLTYHSSGNLVLWPWGYTYDPIADANDRLVHETMGTQYASYTNYTPQQASDLYITSGTTDDWSYGTTMNDAMPCFSFTVEMGNEFYPPVSALPQMCADNCDGALYFIDCADNPYKVLGATPTVTITNPQNGATVSGTVTITCSADPEIAKVEFFIDDSLKYTDTSSPFTWDWDTTQYTDGNHTILVKGYDSGNSFQDDDSVTVNVNNGQPSYVTITSPQNGETVSGFIAITTDTFGIDTVEFYIDNKLKNTDTSAPFEYNWNTKSSKDGSVTITVKGYSSGVFKDDDSVTVTVKNKATIAILSFLVLFLTTGIYKRR